MLSGILGKKKGCMLFAPFTNHFLGRHAYKKMDGLFSCKDRADAIAIACDLLENGHLDAHTAGIIILGGSEVTQRVTIGELRAAMATLRK